MRNTGTGINNNDSTIKQYVFTYDEFFNKVVGNFENLKTFEEFLTILPNSVFIFEGFALCLKFVYNNIG